MITKYKNGDKPIWESENHKNKTKGVDAMNKKLISIGLVVLIMIVYGTGLVIAKVKYKKVNKCTAT